MRLTKRTARYYMTFPWTVVQDRLVGRMRPVHESRVGNVKFAGWFLGIVSISKKYGFKMKSPVYRLLQNAIVPFRFSTRIPLNPIVEDKIHRIVTTNEVISSLPAAREVEIQIKKEVPAGTKLSKAHNLWKESSLPTITTPTGLPRQSDQEICPSNIIHLSISCIEINHPGMGSFFGFTGYYLSVLISLDKGMIWDARGEQVSH